MLTPVDYLWVFTILLVLGEGCRCCVPCLELALLVTAFPHRLQWRTYRVPCSQMGCITLSKCVWDTRNQTCFWLLYPFPFSSRFGCIPDHIRFFSTVSLRELPWYGSLLELFSVTFSLLVKSCSTPWLLGIYQVHQGSKCIFSLLLWLPYTLLPVQRQIFLNLS